MKTCIKCEIKKELCGFAKNKSHKDGYVNICKECGKIYQKIKKGTSDISIDEFDSKYVVTKKLKLDSKTKFCSTCKAEKDKGLFFIRQDADDGLTSQCKECREKVIKNIEQKNIKEYEDRMSRLIINKKLCSNCEIEKPLKEFTVSKRLPSGRMSWCRICVKEHKKQSELQNKLPHLESDRRYRESNRIKVRASQRTYRQTNPRKYSAWAAKRRAAQLQRLPKWADLKTIEAFYENCPPGMTVDHIIPLQGKFISGLHIESNLQYLTLEDNSKKGNRIDLDLLNKNL